MPARWPGFGTLTVAAACGWYMALQWPVQEGAREPMAAPAALVAPQQATPQRRLFDLVQTSGVAAAALPSLARQIERLSASANPKDLYAAFQIAFACKRARDAQRRGERSGDTSVEASCGDITQRQLMGMGGNLEKAAAAGIPGAVQELFEFGPLDGDPSALDTRPSDPLVMAWKQHMQELFAASARHGDLESMATLSQAYQIGYFDVKDAALALAYEVARHELLIQRTDARHVGILRNRVRLGDLTAGMTQEQIAAASALGRSLVAQCCSR